MKNYDIKKIYYPNIVDDESSDTYIRCHKYYYLIIGLKMLRLSNKIRMVKNL
jgi:hypothetical protein